MEAARENYLRLTGLSPLPRTKPYVIYMMGTRAEWALLTKNVVRVHKEIFLSIQAGGFCYDGICLFWDIGGFSTFSLSAHEGLHQFLHFRLRNHLPMWVEEGLCVSAEGYEMNGNTVRFTPDRNPFRFRSLRRGIVEGYWIPLDKLLPMDAGDAVSNTDRAVSYYAQLWALSILLRTHPSYSPQFRRLLTDAAAGRFREALDIPTDLWPKLRGRVYNRTISEPVFRRYISEDLDAFETEYLDFARRLAGLK